MGGVLRMTSGPSLQSLAGKCHGSKEDAQLWCSCRWVLDGWHWDMLCAEEVLSRCFTGAFSGKQRDQPLFSGRGDHLAQRVVRSGYLRQLLCQLRLQPVPSPILLRHLGSIWADVLDPLVPVPGWQYEGHCAAR